MELVSFPVGLFSPVFKRRIPHLSASAKLAFLSAGLHRDPPSLLPLLLTPSTAPCVLLSVSPSSLPFPCRSLSSPVSRLRLWGVFPWPPHPSFSSSPCGITARLSPPFPSPFLHPWLPPTLSSSCNSLTLALIHVYSLPLLPSIWPQRGAPVLCHCSACLTLRVTSSIVPCDAGLGSLSPHTRALSRALKNADPAPSPNESLPTDPVQGPRRQDVGRGGIQQTLPQSPAVHGTHLQRGCLLLTPPFLAV